MTASAAGATFFYVRRRRENRSLLARTRRQAETFKDRAGSLTSSAADLLQKSRGEMARQKKGVLEAIDAGRAAYQRVAG